jgi:hypothetical protein
MAALDEQVHLMLSEREARKTDIGEVFVMHAETRNVYKILVRKCNEKTSL